MSDLTEMFKNSDEGVLREEDEKALTTMVHERLQMEEIMAQIEQRQAQARKEQYVAHLEKRVANLEKADRGEELSEEDEEEGLSDGDLVIRVHASGHTKVDNVKKESLKTPDS